MLFEPTAVRPVGLAVAAVEGLVPPTTKDEDIAFQLIHSSRLDVPVPVAAV